jgi:replicative DNA helicase
MAYQAITERTRRFKTLAMDCGIPVVLLCQLNRLADAENRPPELRDLRDSGSIEQDADVVLMLSRHDPRDLADNRINIFIRKNRNGRANVCIPIVGDVSRGFTIFTERTPE